ncbi:hypothetical protein L596_024554 [Steinernema carpocapsae]|uniref:Uncharacterized protein n=1 Tax=Steinernema carpocapsae TaxID=34508 RepID=A0A4U5MH14_STECR|nr:hypothetical protein L596_024554 [Steinernema carpocapsae]
MNRPGMNCPCAAKQLWVASSLRTNFTSRLNSMLPQGNLWKRNEEAAMKKRRRSVSDADFATFWAVSCHPLWLHFV